MDALCSSFLGTVDYVFQQDDCDGLGWLWVDNAATAKLFVALSCALY